MARPRNALVTGANKGIGYAIAQGLGQDGFTVWLSCRDTGRGQAAAERLQANGIDARFLQLDVLDEASVDRAAARLSEDGVALDLLVNNAGISYGAPFASAETPDDVRSLLETNLVGPWRVARAFLPLLRQAACAGRADIVMLSSSLGSVTRAGDPRTVESGVVYAGYCASKAALNMLTVKLATELQADGIRVNAVNPGHVATDLGGSQAPLTPEEGAQTVLAIASDDRPVLTGAFLEMGPGGVPVPVAW